MRKLVIAAAAALCSCVIDAPAPPFKGGSGVEVDEAGRTISLAPQVVQPAECAAGQYVRKSAAGWECGAPAAEVDQTKTPVASGCTAGQLVSKTASGWACVDPPAGVNASQTPVLVSCEVGKVVRRTETGWDCVALPAGVDPSRTPVVTACQNGQVVRMTSAGWECFTPATAVDPATTPVVATCATGQTVRRTQAGWECFTPTAVDPATTPVVTTCAPGQTVRRTQTGWECFVQGAPPVVKTATRTATPVGECLTLAHGFGSRTVGFSAWMSSPGSGIWMPVPARRNSEYTTLPGGNATLWTATASETAVGAVVSNPAGWAPQTPGWAASAGAWWELDLGAVAEIDTLQYKPWTALPPSNTRIETATWQWKVSVDGVNYADLGPRGSLPAGYNSSYDTTIQFYTDGFFARYLRFVGVSAGAGGKVALGMAYPSVMRNWVTQPDADTVAVCNWSLAGMTRDLALTVWQ